jgi:hypothetical protein
VSNRKRLPQPNPLKYDLSMRELVAIAVLLIGGNPWEDLMGHKPNLWTDPQARFYLDLPIGWTSAEREGVPVVDFWKTHPDHGFVAHVTVEMRALPPNVAVKHFALSVTKDVQGATKFYKKVGERAIGISGTRGLVTEFTHREMGNATLINEVTQVVFIMGERAFIIMMENASGTRPVFQEDFDVMLKGFVGRAPGQETVPTTEPGKRKKVKSGEMINPDAIKY